MMRLGKLASSVALFGAIAAAQSAPPPAKSFALFSPAMIAQLRPLANTPTALHITDAAKSESKAAPGAIVHVHTEGTLPHQGIWDASVKAEQDWPIMLNLALAYRLTGDRKFLDAESRFLAAWAATYHPDMNPIDETSMEKVIFAFDLTRDDLPVEVQQPVLAMFRVMATGYLEHIEKLSCGKDVCNWQSHRIKLATLTAYELGDAELIARARHFFAEQVKCNIRPDGSVEDFYKRDALHYVVYDLEPLQTAALAARAHGEDWFHLVSPTGSSLPSAVDWLLPYTSGKPHMEFVRSSVPFDATRDKAGLAGYSGPWDVRNGITTLTLAARLDARFTPALALLMKHTGVQPQPWLQLLLALKM